MRHPQPRPPRVDAVPAVPTWATLVPDRSLPVDEATMEVPVIAPAAGKVTDPATDGANAEVTVDTEQALLAEATPPTAAEAVAPTWPARADPAPDSGPPSPGLRPGDVAQEPIAVWPGDQAQRIRDQWRDLQVLFIDEPDEAVAGARSLVTEAVRTLSDRLLAEQEEFDPRRDNDQPDTEALRIAMRRYREFLDRVLAL